MKLFTLVLTAALLSQTSHAGPMTAACFEDGSMDTRGHQSVAAYLGIASADITIRETFLDNCKAASSAANDGSSENRGWKRKACTLALESVQYSAKNYWCLNNAEYHEGMTSAEMKVRLQVMRYIGSEAVIQAYAR